MFLFLILISLFIVGQTHARAQDNEYSAPNQLYYEPYGPSGQYGAQQPYGAQFGAQAYGGGQPYGQGMAFGGGQAPCGRSGPMVAPGPIDQMEEELNNKIGRETGVPLEPEPTGIDAQQPANGPAVAEAPCDKPGSEQMPLELMCSLPPHKGTGDDDIFRYYYNPVVQQCIPFSYSGKGGNANRFVSVKNCYEICHPADPTVKKPRVVSGIKAYLVPNLKSDCNKKEKNKAFGNQKVRQQPKEVVIRQIPHPLDPTKTLTIIQNAHYVTKEQMSGGMPSSAGNPNDPNLDPNVRRLYQYQDVPQYMSPYGSPYGQPYG